MHIPRLATEVIGITSSYADGAARRYQNRREMGSYNGRARNQNYRDFDAKTRSIFSVWRNGAR